jgi:hypothetical protein
VEIVIGGTGITSSKFVLLQGHDIVAASWASTSSLEMAKEPRPAHRWWSTSVADVTG